MFVAQDSKIYKIFNFIEKPILYITVLFIIIEGPSVYSYAQFGFSWLVNVFRIIVAILLFSLIIINVFRAQIVRSMIKKWLILCAVYYFVVILELAATFTVIGVKGYLYFYGIVLPLLFTYFSLKMCVKEGYAFFYAFADIVFIISIISLFFWLFGSTLGIITTNESIIVSFGDPFESPSYLGIYFEHQTVNVFGIENVIRNQGIFCEGPLFAAYLGLALCVEIYMRPYKQTIKNRELFIQNIRQFNVIKTIILFTTLITTLTSTGYILVILFLISMFFLYPINRRYAFNFKLILGIVLLIIAAAGVLYVILAKSDSMSFRVRFDDYVACFKAWLTSPLFGVGAMNQEPILAFISDFRASNYGLSSGLGNVFAQGGIILFVIVYCLPLIYWLFKTVKNKNWSMLYFVVAFIMIFALTVIDHTVILMSMLAIGYANIVITGQYSMFYFPQKAKIDNQLC